MNNLSKLYLNATKTRYYTSQYDAYNDDKMTRYQAERFYGELKRMQQKMLRQLDNTLVNNISQPDPDTEEYGLVEPPDFKLWESRVTTFLSKKGVRDGEFPRNWEEGYRSLYESKKTPKFAADCLMQCCF